jgi:glucosamine-6-phosphate deaminase
MEIILCKDTHDLGEQAAALGSEAIRKAIEQRGEARIILATGASQFDVLSALSAGEDIRWDRVTAFHLDEYLGIPITHPASFRRYLWERFVRRLPYPLKEFHFIDGESADPAAECRRVGEILALQPVDVAFIGIGENGHIAFNDPPADFTTEEPFILVDLDEACRRQQFGEGWFPTLDDVPSRAISMSPHQIMKSRKIICSVPDRRKAEAVKAALEGPVTPKVPASILQTHGNAAILLDPESASLLSNAT